MGHAAVAVRQIEDDGPVTINPAESAARIMEELRRDPEALRAAGKVDNTADFIRVVRADAAGLLQRPLGEGARRISQADVAKALGCSTSYVSQFINGKFPVPKEELAFAKKMGRFLSREGRRAERLVEAEFVETSIARQVDQMLQDAHDYHHMVLVVGRSGIGKSVAARRYTEVNEGVIYILAGVQIAAPRSFLSHLADVLGLAHHLRFGDLFKSVTAKLRDSRRLLIVDEAEFLTGSLGERTLDMLRQLWEKTAIGLVFVSNEQFWKRLSAERTAEQMEKFTTRLAARVFLRARLSRRDVDAIISRRLDAYDPEVAEVLFARAQDRGALRAVAYYCQQAAIEAANDGGRATAKILNGVRSLVEGRLEDMYR